MIPIIIPVYGKLDLTAQCLSSIAENTRMAHRVIIVEDGSREPVTADWLMTHGGGIDLLIHEQNQGYTRAVNTGIRYALEFMKDWTFLVLLNNDTQVQKGWLEALNETATMAKGVGVIGAKLLSMDNPDQILHGGTLDLLGTHKGGSDAEGHCNQRTEEIWVTFACVGITREMLIQCGLLDPLYENFCSDSDYCLTAKSRGFRVIYQPKCRVLHHQSATVRDAVPGAKLAKDQQRLLNKWGGNMIRGWINELPLKLSRGQGG